MLAPLRALARPALVAAAVAAGGPSCTATPTPPVEAAPTPGTVADDEPATRAPLAVYGLEHVGVDLPGDDICERDEDGELKNPIPQGTYRGLLRNARCEQQKFLTMARISKALGVSCEHCHVPDPHTPDKQHYAEHTDNKRIANWMYQTFVQGLRPKDGSAMMCASCHRATPDGEPTAKILKDPRDQDYAQEWMHEVMTSKFVEANGKRLRCKTCHIGMAPDTAGWIGDVIRQLRYDGAMERHGGVTGDGGE